MEDAFGFTETVDQLTAITEVKADMEKPVPMDRVICGDVGYGKTEIAVRAAFKAVQDGKQVAVLVPTTLLADQHLQTFSERMAGFPVTVKGAVAVHRPHRVARRCSTAWPTASVDIVIGTHRLLQTGVRWKDLGLVVVDEEQRFGVEHKEHIKALRTHVDVLTMSATPIPRTLEMSLAGIREMSTILTPPEERYPVLTYVGPHDDKQVAAALRRELLRDGQAFYIHNRVGSIDEAAARMQALVPEARVVVAHGQMPEEQLERTVEGFWNREYDILVCTTIVETGLDISNANTLIVERADTFGLSQLHQLRGRVGRSRERGYAYFLYPPEMPLTETAYDRLATIAQNNELGAGMAVAMKDLEIRGAGNVLGVEQSGHVAGRRLRPVRAAGRRGRRGVPRRRRRQDRCRRRGTEGRPDRSAGRRAPAAGLHRQRPAAAGGLSPAGGGRRRGSASTRSSRNSTTGTARCRSPPSGWWRWPGCGCCAASTASRRSARPDRGLERCALSPLTLLDSAATPAEADVSGRALPRDDVDGAGADSRGRATVSAHRGSVIWNWCRWWPIWSWRSMENRRTMLI